MLRFDPSELVASLSSIEKSLRIAFESTISSPANNNFMKPIYEYFYKNAYQWNQLIRSIRVNSTNEYDPIFVPQYFSWDCGLACCSMVLKWLGRDISFLRDHYLYNRETPLWTIELYCFLRECNINCLMLTRFAGIAPSHKEISWYNTNFSDMELDHVASCFSSAKLHNWKVLQESISNECIATFVNSFDNIAIVLVDSATLTRSYRCDEYSGHYIVIVGYDKATDSFTYLNPADSSGLKSMSGVLFEQARTHQGTDEDIILCSKSFISLELITQSMK